MRLLVIEDEPKIARALKKGLEQEGFAVDIEQEATAGQLAAESIDYDLLIIDRMLPDGDGSDVIATLRERDVGTPAILLTALGQTAHKIEGLRAGADDYLAKPFDFEELVARVQALLRRPPYTNGDTINLGRVTIDLENRSLTVDDHLIKLTQKEFAVVDCLVRNTGYIRNKDYLIEHVWDFDADILPNTVEAVIKNIRSKIDNQYNFEFITTVRGSGYVIEAQ